MASCSSMQAMTLTGPTAATANLNVDIEHALESLGPGHRDVPFSG